MKKTAVPNTQNFRGRRVLVVGLGLHGGAASAVRWFHRRGAIIRVQDRKDRQQLAPTIRKLKGLRVTYHLGGHTAADFAWAEFIYVNQGVPLDLPALRRAQQRGVPLLNETTIFFDQCPSPIVGITGTRGKSTTTTLLGQIFRQARRPAVVAGNLRTTLMLDVLDRLTPSQTAILELSSFQLEYLPMVKRSPRVAVMTNLKIDHLNRYPSLTAYAAAKYQIFRYQTPNDIAVLNAENSWTRRATDHTSANVWWFQGRGMYGQQGTTVSRGWVVEYHERRSKRLFPVRAIALAGRHNLENVLAAASAARSLGIPAKPIAAAVRTFSGLAHRQELVRVWRGHRFINDTTATTPDGALAALAVFPQAVYIIGGTDKQLQFSRMAEHFYRRKVPLVFLPGTATVKIIRALRRLGDTRVHEPVADMTTAVHQAVELAKTKQDIVLSPGAASFGLFVHEFDRGERFCRAVKALR